MRFVRQTPAAFVTLLLAGCTHPSSMVAIGPHTYTATASASVLKGGSNVAVGDVYAAADKRCKEDGGGPVTPIRTHEVSSLASVPTLSNGYTLTFRCAPPSPYPPDDRPMQ